MGEGQFLVNRANIDDLAGTLGTHPVADGGLGDEEHALEVHVKNEVEVLLGDVPKISVALESSVVDEEIDAAELLDGFGDDVLSFGNFADVALNGNTSYSELIYVADGVVSTLLVRAETDGDIRPFLGEAQRDAPSDALVSTCD